MILPDIRNVLEEQHGKDKVFVSISTDGTTERIARGPQGFVDRVLTDFVVHESSWYEENHTMCCIHRRKFGADNTLRCVFRHVKAASFEVDFS